MRTLASLLPAGAPAVRPDRLRLAAAAYLARLPGPSGIHTGSDLRVYLAWCAEYGVDPLAATRRLAALAAASRMRMPPLHPHMLRHTFVTTMLDAGVDLRDVQIAARHADPRTTMRYDRARNQLDRHPNYLLAAYMGSGS